MSMLDKIHKITIDNIKNIMLFHGELIMGKPNRIFENNLGITLYYKGKIHDLDIYYVKKSNDILVEVSHSNEGGIVYQTSSKPIDIPSDIARFIDITCYSAYYHYILSD